MGTPIHADILATLISALKPAIKVHSRVTQGELLEGTVFNNESLLRSKPSAYLHNFSEALYSMVTVRLS